MPEINEVEFEGELTLGYFSEDSERQIRLDGKSMDMLVSEMLDFPNSDEFDQIFTRLDEMRAQDVQPIGNEPDLVREAGRYKIKIEKVDSE